MGLVKEQHCIYGRKKGSDLLRKVIPVEDGSKMRKDGSEGPGLGPVPTYAHGARNISMLNGISIRVSILKFLRKQSTLLDPFSSFVNIEGIFLTSTFVSISFWRVRLFKARSVVRRAEFAIQVKNTTRRSFLRTGAPRENDIHVFFRRPLYGKWFPRPMFFLEY